MISAVSRTTRCGLSGSIIALVLFWTAAANAQDGYELGLIEDRLKQLERQVSSLQRSVSGVDAANTALRLDQLETELRKLTGKVEETRFSLDAMERDAKRFRRNTDDRLTVLEGGEPAGDSMSDDTIAALPADTGQVAPLTSLEISRDKTAVSGTLGTVRQDALPPSPSDEANTGAADFARAPASVPEPSGAPPASAIRGQYNAAITLMRKRRFAEAGAAFEQIVRRHPDDPLAGNAQYWLGQTYYSRGQYEEAANEYLDGYRNYPDGSKAPDSLLKLGMTLERLGQPDEACLTYDEVTTRYPRASATVKRRTESEKAKIGCQ